MAPSGDRGCNAAMPTPAFAFLLDTGAALLLLAGFAAGQRDAWPTARSHSFTGVLVTKGGPVRFQMSLDLPEWHANEAVVAGEYRYDLQGAPLRLRGTLQQEARTIRLDEFAADGTADGVCTGRFEGTVEDGLCLMQGTWTSADGKKRFPFELQMVAALRSVNLRRPPNFTWDDASLEFLGDGLLAREATRRRREAADVSLAHAERMGADSLQAWRAARKGGEATKLAPSYLVEGECVEGVHHHSERLISIGGRVSEFTGGAHHNYGFSCCNLALRDGRCTELTLQSMLADAAAGPRLCTLVCEQLRAAGASSIPPAPECRLTTDDLACFVLSPAGIRFAFGPYHVGSFAEGPYFVFLTWQQTKGVLVPPPELGL